VAIEYVHSLDDVRVADYRNVPDAVLLRERGVFVAEGRLVVRTLLDQRRHPVRSVLLTPAARDAMADALDPRPDVPVFVAPLDLVSAIVGFHVHRGCLAIGERTSGATAAGGLHAAVDTSLIVVAEQVGNADNMGAVFRNARAFGAGCVLLSPECCDPLYRKAIRVSLGASLRLPFAEIVDWPDGLQSIKDAGYAVVALTPEPSAAELTTFAARRPARIALLMGHEGLGLSLRALTYADARVRVAMRPGMDSINVATAAAIAMYVCRDPLGPWSLP
jgi:tRNA G18 (ribose-2'-O)-methylase SpoU